MSVKPIPEGYTTVTPYLYIKGAAEALDFYKKAFDAVELFRMADPTGRIGHAEIQIGNARIMLAEENAAMSALSPLSLGGATSSILLYVDNVDARFAQAIAAGGTVMRSLTDQFYGDRSSSLKDPFGHQWTLATHVEDVSPEEIERRIAAMK